MNKKLAFEAFYPHSPERVWKALTDPAVLEQWLMPANFKPLMGFRFRLDGLGRGEKSSVQGEVLEAIEAKRLKYTWDDGEAGAPSIVTWSLHPRDGGTLVRLEHSAEPEVKPIVLIEANMNWRYILGTSLPAWLRRRPTPIVYVDVEEKPKDQPERKAGFRWQEAAV